MRRFAPCSHSLLAEERFRDQTRHVIEFEVLCPDSFLALPGEYVRLFLSEPSYQRMLRCGITARSGSPRISLFWAESSSYRPKPPLPHENNQWEVLTDV